MACVARQGLHRAGRTRAAGMAEAGAAVHAGHVWGLGLARFRVLSL